MATRRTNTARHELPVSGDHADDDFPADAALPAGARLPVTLDDELPSENATDRVMALLSDVADDDRAKVVIYRKLPNTTKQSWCDELTPSDFEAGGIRMMRDRFGEGEYAVYLYGMRNGQFGIRTKAEIRIDKSNEPKGAASDPAAPSSDAMRQLTDLVRAVVERPVPTPVDPLKGMAEMFLLMKNMREAMGDDRPQRNSIKDAVEAIQLLREASDVVAPPKDEPADDSLMGMAKSLLPMIAAHMQAQRNGTQLGDTGAVAVPADVPGDALALALAAPVAAPVPVTPGAEPMSSEALIAMKLRAYVGIMLGYAAANADVEKGAALIADKLPDEWLDMLEMDEWWLLFSAQVPQALPYEAWFRKARDRALEMLDEPGDEDTQTGVRELAPPAA